MSLSPKVDIGTTSDASDETTPLLNGASSTPSTEAANSSRQHQLDDESDSESSEQEEAEKIPLPKAQIFLLCYTAIVEPIAFFGIFPYINFMIEKVGNVDEKEVGFYSGLIESLFSATQMCVMIIWGKVRMLLHRLALKLNIVGFRSIWAKANSGHLLDRICRRNHVVWHEPVVGADDCR
jgi:hypothetical protein